MAATLRSFPHVYIGPSMAPTFGVLETPLVISNTNKKYYNIAISLAVLNKKVWMALVSAVFFQQFLNMFSVSKVYK